MDTTSKSMYHFMWEDGEPLYEDKQQISPKERVAKILKETELPDLVFRTKAENKKNRKQEQEQKARTPLKTDQELFSIGDSESEDENIQSDFHNEVVVNKLENTKVEASQQYQYKKPASVPPVVSTQHPKIELPTLKEPDSRNYSNTTALLPTTEIEFEEFDDDIDSGVAEVDASFDATHENENQDTEPIITVDQVKLTERWRKRRQRINIGVALALLVVGVSVLIVSIILIVTLYKT